MANWIVVDRNGNKIAVDAHHMSMDSRGSLIAASQTDKGYTRITHAWAPGEWSSYGTGGEDAYAIVMRRAATLREKAASMEALLLCPLELTMVNLVSWRKMAEDLIELSTLRREISALESVAEALKGK